MDSAWLAPALCAVAFFVNVVLSRQLGRLRHPVAGAVSVGAIVASFVIFLMVLTDARAHLPPFAGGAHNGEAERHLLFDKAPWFTITRTDFWTTMSIDWLSIMMLGVVTFLSALIQIYALGYMRGDNRFWWFFAVMSLFSASMLVLVLAYDFLLLYIGWELVGLCSFLLIGFWHQERDNAEAAKKAFITTRIGDVGLFVGLAILFLNTGTFRMDEIFEVIERGRLDPLVVTAAGILVFMGAVGKSGQFPLHVWLPDAMAGPTPVSALVHSATMVAAGVYLVGRAYPLFAASEITMGVIATIGTFTAIFAATIALTQREIKKILAYSTVSQLGYMIAGLGVGAYTAGLFHLFTHSFFKALLFLGAGSMIHAMEAVYGHHDKRANDIFNMGGLRKGMPITFWTFLIAALSLAGIFPLAGFWSKDEILVGAADSGNWVVLVVLLLAAFMTAFYMFRAIFVAFFGEPRWRGPDVRESPWVMVLPLLLIGIPAVAAGWLNIPGVYAPFGEAIHFGEAHHAEGLNYPLAIAGTLAGLLGIGLAAVMYWRPVIDPSAIAAQVPQAYRTLWNKYYFDEAYQWVIDRIVLALAGLAATFDRKVVNDNVADRPAHLTIAAGDKIRYLETGRVYHYAFAFVVGIVVVGVAMTRFPLIQFNFW